MAMGHVILKENFVDRKVEYFDNYVKHYTDMGMLVTLEEHPDGHGLTASKFLTAADLPTHRQESDAQFKTVMWDQASWAPAVPNGSRPHPRPRQLPGSAQPRDPAPHDNGVPLLDRSPRSRSAGGAAGGAGAHQRASCGASQPALAVACQDSEPCTWATMRVSTSGLVAGGTP